MAKNSYPLANQEVNILTPPNPTYGNKEIEIVVTTTAGVFVQSGRSIKISKPMLQTTIKRTTRL